jgi:UDP-N-acetylglucosamine/UDP-N-acetylgalactosamine diphosphorylase
VGGDLEPDLRGSLEAKLDLLEAKGVTVIDRRQTYLDEAIDESRICRGAVLYPGTRLVGARTFVGPGAKVGIEGPAVLVNTIIGKDSEVASGYLNEAVMLRNARVGSNAHIRVGTLMEEESSTAHAVGLKHTVLMSFVTMGSLINFCDGLISGGKSRREHTEVGSGFIHFNYKPRGKSGDKATPSLIGDVVHGVFLRQQRIFLGGLSGIVGPQKVGFGSFTIAGQVLRREVPSNRVVGDVPRKVDRESYAPTEAPSRILKLNLEYIGQLTALQTWYREVRLARIPASREYAHIRVVTRAALELLSVCIDERVERLRQFLEERGLPIPCLSFTSPPCPLSIEARHPYFDHIEWIMDLSQIEVEKGASWLRSIVDGIVAGESGQDTGRSNKPCATTISTHSDGTRGASRRSGSRSEKARRGTR